MLFLHDTHSSSCILYCLCVCSKLMRMRQLLLQLQPKQQKRKQRPPQPAAKAAEKVQEAVQEAAPPQQKRGGFFSGFGKQVCGGFSAEPLTSWAGCCIHCT